MLRSLGHAILAHAPDAADKLTPADPRDLAEAIAFALRCRGGKRVHQADECMAKIAAERIVEHLARARFVVMKPPQSGGAALGGVTRAADGPRTPVRK